MNGSLLAGEVERMGDVGYPLDTKDCSLSGALLTYSHLINLLILDPGSITSIACLRLELIVSPCHRPSDSKEERGRIAVDQT